MRVTLKCKHRTLTVDAAWDDLSPVYAADRVRAMLLTCPECDYGSEAFIEPANKLTVAPRLVLLGGECHAP